MVMSKMNMELFARVTTLLHGHIKFITFKLDDSAKSYLTYEPCVQGVYQKHRTYIYSHGSAGQFYADIYMYIYTKKVLLSLLYIHLP